MKLKLEFQYRVKPLKVFIDDDWERIIVVGDLDLAELFEDDDLANKVAEELSRIPRDAWFVYPDFDEELGLRKPVRDWWRLGIPDKIRLDINHLDEYLQKTYDKNQWNYNTVFPSKIEENRFRQDTENLADEIIKHLPAEWQFEFRALACL
jgi:hypothetical protein